MSEPFLGEVKMYSFAFPPRGWAVCNGQVLPINQNQALFSILGTTYGGDGITTFALPDLRGRTPVHAGNQIQLGQKAGEEAHSLSLQEMPAHSHAVACAEGDGSDKVASSNTWAKSGNKPYGSAANAVMSSLAVGTSGTGQAHENMQPYGVVNFCIALQGIYPTRD